ncbi:hypothetical protein ER308_11170 [Egibacter rhizosphaerae]|uniref:DUF4352 domain-containing protein n=1 Tax=Egibacter rhizosphaerae TaxID=1670831 RepID=A0A411YFU8_9ACTN|nr:hypothetical protein [Egibacter rhizosphaerae]QBI20066.1 hypothetical protein ER308_11170 [Egibacter rhizosphaerae]
MRDWWRHGGLLGLLVVLAFALMACGEDEDAETETVDDEETEAETGDEAEDGEDEERIAELEDELEEAREAAGDGADGPDGGDEGAGSDDEETEGEAEDGSVQPGTTRTRGEPLAELPGPLDGEVTAYIDQFARRGELVELSFTIVNSHESEGWGSGWGEGPSMMDGGLDDDDPANHSIYGVTLVDSENAQRHYPMRDPDGRCTCSSDAPNLNSGDSVGMSATYPAPPDDVDEMTVQIPHFGSIDLEFE